MTRSKGFAARVAELRLDLVYGGFEGSGAFLLKWVCETY